MSQGVSRPSEVSDVTCMTVFCVLIVMVNRFDASYFSLCSFSVLYCVYLMMVDFPLIDYD